MEKRDYLMVQIEQLGRAIGQVLADLLHLKKSGKSGEGMEITINTLKEKIDIDLVGLIRLQEEDFIEFLKNKKKFNYYGLENLADIFYEIGLEKKDTDSFNYFNKALLIYEHIIQDSGTYSFDWTQKISRIEKELQKN